jgi:hypothetical protein
VRKKRSNLSELDNKIGTDSFPRPGDLRGSTRTESATSGAEGGGLGGRSYRDAMLEINREIEDLQASVWLIAQEIARLRAQLTPPS